jgi:hypothetical protein
MKTLLPFFLILFLSNLSFGQQWLDKTCGIENEINSEEYTSAQSNNILTLIINQEGKLLMNGQEQEGLSEIQFKELVYGFLANPLNLKTKSDSPKQAIIALGSYGEHKNYDLILRYVREVYLYAWDTYTQEKYQVIYSDLDCKKREKIRSKNFPYNIIELGKDEEDSKRPSFSPGVPMFSGDVIDN